MKSFFTAAANKVRTFAPSPSKTTLPPEQRLKRNWEYLHTAFYRDLHRQDVAVHDTEWPKRLNEIRNLLLQEERNGREVADTPCMEYFLENDVMMHLLHHCESNVPVGLISVHVEFCTALISELSFPILENARVLGSLFKVLHYGLTRASGLASLENGLVELMFAMSDKLQATPHLISLFFYAHGHDTSSPLYSIDRSRPPSERSRKDDQAAHPKKSEPFDVQSADFPLFVNLMHFVSYPGRTGSMARAAMLLCVEASGAVDSPQIDQYLVEKVHFPSSIASILASLYDAFTRARGEAATDLTTSEPWGEFLQLFKLCQSVMEKGSSRVAMALAESIEDLFCEKMLHSRLLDPATALATTSHLARLFECVTSAFLSRELCVFLVGDPERMLVHQRHRDLFLTSSADGEAGQAAQSDGGRRRRPLFPVLLARMQKEPEASISPDDMDELSVATWRLMWTMLQTQTVDAVPLILAGGVHSASDMLASPAHEPRAGGDIAMRFAVLLAGDSVELGDEYERYYEEAARVFKDNYERYLQRTRLPRGLGLPPLSRAGEHRFLELLFVRLLNWLDNSFEDNLCYSGILSTLALHPDSTIFFTLFGSDEPLGKLPSIRAVLETVAADVAAQPLDPLKEHAARRSLGLDASAGGARPLLGEEADDVDQAMRNALLFPECLKELIAAIHAHGLHGDAALDYASEDAV